MSVAFARREERPVTEKLEIVERGIEIGARVLPNVIKIAMFSIMTAFMITVMGSVWSGLQYALPFVQVITPIMTVTLLVLVFVAFAKWIFRVLA